MVVPAHAQEVVLGGTEGVEDGASDDDVAGLLRWSGDRGVEDVSRGELRAEGDFVDLVEGRAVMRNVVCVVVVEVKVERPIIEVVEGVLRDESSGVLHKQHHEEKQHMHLAGGWFRAGLELVCPSSSSPSVCLLPLHRWLRCVCTFRNVSKSFGKTKLAKRPSDTTDLPSLSRLQVS